MKLLRRYYKRRQHEGMPFLVATLILPWRAYKRHRRRHRNVLVGLKRYELPILVSYSRSGTNWIRYFIEYCSRQPTPGQTRLFEGTNYIIDRAHCAFPVLHRYARAILVIRDYRECLLRHNRPSWLATRNVSTFLEDESLKQPCSWYIRNIEAVDAFNGEKLVLYYEDLMTAPEDPFRKLGAFLGFPETTVTDFVEHIDDHFRASVKLYTSVSHASHTSSTRSTNAHAKALLSDAQVVEFDDYFREHYPELAQKYLRRYFTPQGTRGADDEQKE